MQEAIALAANLGALSVIGLLYVSYIRNLRSMLDLKDEQISSIEKTLKEAKERLFELERRSPEFVEKQLNDRIKVREDEIKRIRRDHSDRSKEVAQKQKEIESLKISLGKAESYRSSLSVWDREKCDFVEISHTDLNEQYIGSICVDTASIMICDPWYRLMDEQHEDEEFVTQNEMYRVVETGEYFCTNLEGSNIDCELLGLPEDLNLKQLLKIGTIEKAPYKGQLPAVPNSYIKGNLADHDYKPIRHLTFKNGRVGAGVIIGLSGDGVYPVFLETYKGEIQRIVIGI